MRKRGVLVALVLLALGACLYWMAGSGRSDRTSPGAAAGAPAGASSERASQLTRLAAPDPGSAGPPRSVAEPALPVPALVPPEVGSAPPEGTVSVRIVRSDTGGPATGEWVALLPEGRVDYVPPAKGTVGALGEALLVDAQGSCTFHIPAGVRARALPQSAVFSSRRDVEVPVEPLDGGETREVTLVLPVFPHWVRVEDASDGLPLTGAHVQSGGQDLSTSADGLVALWCSALDRRQASIEAEGYGVALIAVQPGHEKPESSLLVRLSRAACLRGWVRDAADGPIEQAGIEVVAQGFDLARSEAFGLTKESELEFILFQDRSWAAETDASGSFLLCGLPPSIPLQVTVAGAGLWLEVPQRVRLAPGEEREVVYQLGTGGTVRGLVRDESGLPVAGCALWLMPGTGLALFAHDDGPPERSPVSNALGRFEIEDVPTGEWALGPAPDTEYLPAPVAVQVPADLASVEVVIEARAALFVAGRVVGPDGQPLTHIEVSSDRGPFGESGEGGAFRIGPFAPGTVTLDVGEASGFFAPEGREVRAGEEGILLRLQAGGRLAGRMVDDAKGQPIGGLVSLSGGDGRFWVSVVDASGRFAFDGLRPGSYGVTARSVDGRAGFLESVVVPEPGAATEAFVVRLVPGGQLALRFPPAEERRGYRVRSGACVQVIDTIGPQEVVTPHLPPGLVTVELFGSENETLLSRQAVVRAGETVLVDLSKEH